MSSSINSLPQAKKEEIKQTLIEASLRSGQKIISIYIKDDQGTKHKDDGSPVTLADKAGEEIIIEALEKQFPQIPILAEESYADNKIPELGSVFFLVDPLDGTKEFIKRNGEFTVNIALIENGIPVAGVVFAPALEKLYFGDCDGAFVQSYKLVNEKYVTNGDAQHLKTLATIDNFSVVASRSHPSPELGELFAHLPPHNAVNAGSSLKFCMIAEGKAHLYPRLTPTMEWDTGAGQAVLNAAGGVVTRLNLTSLSYGKLDKDYLNPFFIAANNQHTAEICARAFKKISDDHLIR